MDWQSVIDKMNEPFAQTINYAMDPFIHNRFRVVKTIPTGTGEMAVIKNGYGNYSLLLPDGQTSGVTLTEAIAENPDKLNAAVQQASNFVSREYMKDSKGNWVPRVIAPNGQSYPSTDYTNQGATYAADGQPTQNTSTSGPGTETPPAQQPATTNIATVTNSTSQPALPPGYSYNPSLPNGYVQGPNNSIVPIAQVPSTGATGGTTTPPATSTGGTGTSTPSNGAGATGGIIDALYQRYFARNATQAEKDNWSKETPASLETFLQSEQGKYGVSGTGNDIIGIISTAVGNPNATDEEILAAFNELKTKSIDPYYQGLISQAQQEVSANIQKAASDRVLALQAEALSTAKNITDTQKSLEASGMTFTGDAIKQLGNLSAFAAPTAVAPSLATGATAKETQPAMTAAQFGLEGTVNTANRLMTESSRSDYAKRQAEQAQAAIKLLGTANIGGLGLTGVDTSTPVTGSIESDKINALQSLAGNVASFSGNLTDYKKIFNPAL